MLCERLLRLQSHKTSLHMDEKTDPKSIEHEFSHVCVCPDGDNIYVPEATMPPDVALWLASELITVARASILRRESQLLCEISKVAQCSPVPSL